MKARILCVTAVLLLTSCSKLKDAIDSTSSNNISGEFIRYSIRKGQQYCDQNSFKTIETKAMKFVVKFDSTAIYQTLDPENQYDINKLYGFSDNNTDHHQYSARFGWRWSDNALRLFAYVYNQGAVISKELATIQIGEEVNCSIGITTTHYLFTVNGIIEQVPRMSITEKGQGYQLYPYFGGDETAPHDITIWIKNLP